MMNRPRKNFLRLLQICLLIIVGLLVLRYLQAECGPPFASVPSLPDPWPGQFPSHFHPEMVGALYEAFLSQYLVKKPMNIFYNRVGKCGSRSFFMAVIKLSKANGTYDIHETDPNLLPVLSQADQVKVVRTFAGFKRPTVYVQHVHYIPFPEQVSWSPVYINMIRDPLQRMISQYYFLRFGDKSDPRNLLNYPPEDRNRTFEDCVLQAQPECSGDSHLAFYIIPYFCGQFKYCRSPNRQALETAKRNLLTRFFVVGYVENMKQFVFVLETLIPSLFKGLSAHLTTSNQNEMRTYQTAYKKAPSPEAAAIMRSRMTLEYEFYNFVKEHFAYIHTIALRKTATSKSHSTT